MPVKKTLLLVLVIAILTTLRPFFCAGQSLSGNRHQVATDTLKYHLSANAYTVYQPSKEIQLQPPYLLPHWNGNHLESSNKTNSNINWPAFAVTSAALAGLYTGLFSYEQNRRWGPPKVPFHFESTWQARGYDKAGHFYAAKTQAALISNLYDLSGLSQHASAWLGAGIALSVQSIIEIKDGKTTSGGFDLYDETANVLGTGWFLAREKVDFLQRFNVRWFYYPSQEKELLADDLRFNDDFSGHTYWLSMRVWDLLPKKMQPYWPKFIVPEAGISLNDWGGPESPNNYKSYHLSISPDFSYILPQHSRLGRLFTDILNGFYIPAPALQVYPHFGVKLIFYGQD